MKKLMQALAAGKRRGYEEIRMVENRDYLFQYCLKKEGSQYVAYVMCIEESKIDNFEDYATENIESFREFSDVLEYFQSHGADVKRFSAIKKALPF